MSERQAARLTKLHEGLRQIANGGNTVHSVYPNTGPKTRDEMASIAVRTLTEALTDAPKPQPSDCGNRMKCGWHKASTEPDINMWLCNEPGCPNATYALSDAQQGGDQCR